MRRSLLGLALLASTALTLPALAQTKVGVAAAVNQEVTGTPPTATSRNVVLGADVFHRERLVTNARGQAQMLFLDGSAFTVGPDSDLVLDEFVYDPATGTGKLAATAAKGLVRFVGGKLSKNQPVTITTPTATIGIRGGIALIEVDPLTGATSATFLFGIEMTVTSGIGAVERIARPGFTTTVQSAAAPPTAAVKASPDQLKQSLDQLNGRPDASGGVAQAPTEGQVGARMPPPPIPGALPPPPPPIGQTGSVPLGPPPPPPSTETQSANQRNAINNAGLPAGTVVAYTVAADPALGTNLPSVRGGATGNTSGTASPLYAVSGGTSGNVKGVQVSVGIEGSGANQRSVVMVTTAESTAEGTMRAGSRGTSRASAAEGATQIKADSTLTGTGTNASFAGGRMADGFVQSGTGSDARLFPAGQGSYTFQQTGTRESTPPVLAARQTATLTGYATGAGDGVRQDGQIVRPYSLVAGTNGLVAADPTAVAITTDAQSGRVAGTFHLTDPGVSGNQQVGARTDVTLSFGGNDTGRSTYVDSTRFAAVESSTGATISTERTTQTASRTELYMVSSGFAPTLPDGVQACQCQFVQWGWWGATIGSVTDDGVGRADRIHMGNWVAGPMVSASDMPTTGSASYSGHAVGSVVNGSARYLAAGNFAAQFDFGRRQGSMTISNFDGMTASGTIVSNNGRDYASDMTVTGRSGLVGQARGSFFSGGGDPVRETGGQFGINAAPGSATTPYAATGIFVGKKQ